MPGDSRQDWGPCPERWADRLAIVVLPEHFGLPDVDRIREQLLSVINRGALVLIADLTATISCDHAGSDALARGHQRAVSSGTELRLVVTSAIVRRVLSISGVDRLVSFYPSTEAALAASAVPVSARSAGAAAAGAAAVRYADLMRLMTHRLFGVGLLLEAAEGLAERPLAGRLSQAIAELDAIIRDTRTAAFESGVLPGAQAERISDLPGQDQTTGGEAGLGPCGRIPGGCYPVSGTTTYPHRSQRRSPARFPARAPRVRWHRA